MRKERALTALLAVDMLRLREELAELDRHLAWQPLLACKVVELVHHVPVVHAIRIERGDLTERDSNARAFRGWSPCAHG